MGRFAVTPCNDYLYNENMVVLKRTVGFKLKPTVLGVETNGSFQNHPNSLEIVITW